MKKLTTIINLFNREKLEFYEFTTDLAYEKEKKNIQIALENEKKKGEIKNNFSSIQCCLDPRCPRCGGSGSYTETQSIH